MPALNLAIQLSSLRLPIRQALRAASTLGVSGVELNVRTDLAGIDWSGTVLRQIRKLLDDLNLKIVALAFPTRRGYNVAEDLDKRIAGTKSAMKLAYDLGARVVTNSIGRIPDKEDDPDWQLLVQVLDDIGRHGLRVGAQLAAETGSASGPDLAKLLAALPDSGIGVHLNPGQLIVNGFSAQEAVESLGSSILYVTAQDGLRDLARGRGVEVELGRGAVDYPAVLAALAERDYRGYFTLTAPNSADPQHDLHRAIQFLRGM